MATADSLFHKTAAGHAACALADCRLPRDYRAILDAVQYATRLPAIAAGVPHCSRERLLGCLEDLEAIGLIESVSLQWLRALYSAGEYEPRPLAR